MTKRNAIIIAVALEVHCPYCGEPQPAPGGSEMWEPREVEKYAELESGESVCVSCDKPFKLMRQSRVNVGG
jgi:DNA-directed RNA polymerase subunit RPC12/RpoP